MENLYCSCKLTRTPAAEDMWRNAAQDYQAGVPAQPSTAPMPPTGMSTAVSQCIAHAARFVSKYGSVSAPRTPKKTMLLLLPHPIMLLHPTVLLHLPQQRSAA